MPPARKKTIYDVILPGTHDTGAYRIPLRDTTPLGAPAILALPPLRWILRKPLSDFSRTQHGPVLSQLRAGSRYQDLRVSAATRPRVPDGAREGETPDRFWLAHGAVACVPLGEVLRDMRTFVEERRESGDGVESVVSVVRLVGHGWESEEAREAVGRRFREALGEENLFQGGAKELREVAVEDLPPHVVVGVPGVGTFGRYGEKWGSDVWIDTYDGKVKADGLRNQVRQQRPREERNGFYVVGWTVTPQPSDIGCRIASCGVARPGLEQEAIKFNSKFADFAEANKSELRRSANVVFFDFVTKELCEQVKALNVGDEEVAALERTGSSSSSSSGSSAGEE